MKKVKGFTLIELLIVVAIIAILAAIAVPNFLEAQIRSKVARANTDMRSLATAIEAYMVDSNMYPAHCQGGTADPLLTVNSGLRAGTNSRIRCTFRLSPLNSGMMTLTSPVAHITSFPPDPFASTKGAVFGYANAAEMGWIIWSYGPDGDETTIGDLDPSTTESGHTTDQTRLSGKELAGGGPWSINSIYNPRLSNPSLALITICTYDPTNGSTSDGDVWRVRQ